MLNVKTILAIVKIRFLYEGCPFSFEVAVYLEFFDIMPFYHVNLF